MPGIVSGRGPCTVTLNHRAVPRLAGDPVGVVAVDPGLAIGEIGDVAAQLAGRCAERVDLRIRRILGLQRKIEGLPEVLGQEPKGVGPQ